MESMNLNLETVPVAVNNVSFDGLARTRPDFVASAVKEVFSAKTFGDLVVRIGLAQDKLRRLEVFREVGVIIDVHKPTSPADAKNEDGYDITFVVKEFGRLAASAETQMRPQADAQVKTGLRMPNVFGCGETLEVKYAYSSGDEKSTEMSFVKPFPYLMDSSLKSTLFLSKTPNIQAQYFNTGTGALITYLTNINFKVPQCHKFEYEGIWREITPTSFHTPFSIRQECGNSFKSAFRHLVTVDLRDKPIFPTQGAYVSFLQEISGLFGDVKYHKLDFDVQHNTPLPLNLAFQVSFRMGVMTQLGNNQKSCSIMDRFFLGGPYSLRGFAMRGIKLQPEGIALGGMAYWSTAAHLYAQLPFINQKFPLVEKLRFHVFANAGNLADRFLSENIIKDTRLAYGIGLAMAIGNFGRLEVNYCWPVKSSSEDKTIEGIQVGVGVHFI